jgi:ribosomal RNA-processing protein 9
MSSFFSVPGQKRKRPAAPDGPKKKLAVSKSFSGPTKTNRAPPRTKSAPAHANKRRNRDESISGSDDDEDGSVGSVEPDSDAPESSESEPEGETAADKRRRLAERYIENVEKEVDAYGFDAEEIDRDLIAERLQEDVAESKGKVYRSLVPELDFAKTTHTFFRADTMAVTSVTAHAPYVYMTTKDLVVQKWRIQDLPQHQYPQTTKKKPKKQAPPRTRPELVSWVRGNFKKGQDKGYKRHTKDILTTAVSSDGKLLVTGGADKRMIVYETETLKPVKVFTQHRDAIMGVAFRRGTNQMYSCSKDRTVKVWSLDELAYLETLFGHGDEVVDIDALAQEKCVSVGARDRTARLWKVADETQLVFRGGAVEKKSKSGSEPVAPALEGSMDRVSMIDDDLFVTGSDNGTIALWNLQKKKPLFLVPNAHGLDDPLPLDKVSAEKHPKPSAVPTPRPRWITALRTVPYSDVILSGSWDGYIRVWQLSEDKKQLVAAGVLGKPVNLSGAGQSAAGFADDGPNTNDDTAAWKIPGVVNDIALFERGDRGTDGLCVVAAVGKEHRLGRLVESKAAKNGGVVFEVPRIPRATQNGQADVSDEDAED